jgi:hypothetical protein
MPVQQITGVFLQKMIMEIFHWKIIKPNLSLKIIQNILNGFDTMEIEVFKTI